MSFRRKPQASTAVASSHEAFGDIPHVIQTPASSLRSFGGSHGNLQSASSYDSWDRHQMAQQRGSMDNVSIASDATDWKVIGGRRFQAAQEKKSSDDILEHMRSRGTTMSREQSFMSDSEIYEPRKSLSRSSLIGCGSKATTPTPRATPKQSSRRALRSRDQQQPLMLGEAQATGLSESSTASSGMFPPGPILAFQLPRLDPATGGGEQYMLAAGQQAGGRVLYTDADLDQYMASIERSRAVRAPQQLSYALLPTLRQLDRRGDPAPRRAPRTKHAYKQREIERLSGSNQDIYSSLSGGGDPARRDMSERTRRALRHIVRKY